MKALLYTLAALLFLNICSAQTKLITGQKQGMMFTDIAPDKYYGCSWAYGARTCNAQFPFDVNHDGINDFKLSAAYVECMYTWYNSWYLSPVGNVEFVVDSLGVTLFEEGDSIETGWNYEEDFKFVETGLDSNYNPIYDSAFFVRNGRWVDTADHHTSRAISHVGNITSCPGPGMFNWILGFPPDTVYIAFRLIENADTAYGWLKLFSSGTYSVAGESFAITGDTGSFVYNSTEELSREPEIKLYPIPASGKLMVESPFQEYEMEILSLDGRKQWSTISKRKSETIDVSNLAAGFYFISFKADGKIITKRWVKE